MKKQYKSICILESPIGNLMLGDKVVGEVDEIIVGSREPGQTFTVVRPAQKIEGEISVIVSYSDYFGNCNRFSVTGEHGFSEIDVRNEGFRSTFGQDKITLTKVV